MHKHCAFFLMDFDNPLKKVNKILDWLCIFCNQIILLSIFDLIHHSIISFCLKKSFTNRIVLIKIKLSMLIVDHIHIYRNVWWKCDIFRELILDNEIYVKISNKNYFLNYK